jgi:hypothetical protein
MTKQKSAHPFIGVPTTTPVTDTFLATGNHDMVYWGWWAGIRRTVANFFTEKAKRLRASPEDVRKTPLTVTEQIELLEQLQRLGAGTGDRRYGSYPQEPVRCRPYVDHLVRRAKVDVREPDEPSDQSDDQST